MSGGLSPFGRRAGVHIVDLTCRSAPYDAQLVSALQPYLPELTLWLSGCLAEQALGSTAAVRGRSLSGGVNLRRRRLRAGVKALEYAANTRDLVRGCGSGSLVHFQWLPMLERWPRFDLGLLRSLRRRGVSLVYTVHNVLPHDSGERLKETFRRAYGLLDALICHTRQSRERLVEEFDIDPDTLHLIPHGPLPLQSSEDILARSVQSAYGLAPDEPFVLMFGFMRPYKGAEELIAAWRSVHDACPGLRLLLVGSGEKAYTDRLRRQILDRGLERSITTDFRFVPESHLRVLLDEAALLVYPYRQVTQSGALLAGMAAGATVIASRVGGFDEAVEHGRSGWLVPPNSASELATAILALMADAPRREALGQGARDRVHDAFSWDRIARRTVACYDSVLG